MIITLFDKIALEEIRIAVDIKKQYRCIQVHDIVKYNITSAASEY